MTLMARQPHQKTVIHSVTGSAAAKPRLDIPSVVE